MMPIPPLRIYAVRRSTILVLCAVALAVVLGAVVGIIELA
jgi:ABC-type dipeptide/oligopeptide/nickel transport system permease subunit